MQSIKVKHNMEMAHRLSLTPGKCEAIHGHSWWVELEIAGPVDSKGMILEFGEVKKVFREYLDTTFDHQLLLHNNDPVAKDHLLPGLVTVPWDPTTENVAMAIGLWAIKQFKYPYTTYKIKVTVWETSVNAATWEGDATPHV